MPFFPFILLGLMLSRNLFSETDFEVQMHFEILRYVQFIFFEFHESKQVWKYRSSIIKPNFSCEGLGFEVAINIAEVLSFLSLE